MVAFIYGRNPVEFWEAMEGSQDAQVSARAQAYRTIWKVRWEDVELAKLALLGETNAVGVAGLPGGQKGFWSRYAPHPHPRAPWLVCTDITKVEGRVPRGKDEYDCASYEWAFLYAIYTKLGAAILDDTDLRVTGGPGQLPDEYRLARYVRRRRRAAMLHMTSRVAAWRWLDRAANDPNSRVAFELPWRLPRLRVLLTWMRVPIANLNEAYINDSLGTTNAEAFGPYDAQTCMLNAADWPDWEPMPGKDGLWVDVQFEVIYFPPIYHSDGGIEANGPNFFPDPLRGNTLHEAGLVLNLDPLVIRHPIPVRSWKPMFWPINVEP
jgi:hypothetical protein